MSFAPGHELGDYEIIEQIGSGGMGQVYRAIDRKLNREVAIKIIHRDDAQSVARFEQEARALAALSHPNVLQVHQFGIAGDTQYLVTELLEGKTLRACLSRGSLPWRRAIDIASRICDGLAAAHAKGIVHRDLKPDNIMITPDDQVKILDFGLVRSSEEFTESDPTRARTAPGAVIGTLLYMSPEQLRGETVDATTDLFSLGSIIHEMITGRPPFLRPSASETTSAILRDEPPALERVPDSLQALVSECLARDRGRRLQSAHDLGLRLRRLTHETHGKSRPAMWIALVLLLAAAAVVVWIARDDVAPHETVREAAASSPRTLSQLTSASAVEQFPSWSPDGKWIVFTRETGNLRKLFLKSIGDAEERQLTFGDYDDIYPAWSPDGKTILFVRSREKGQRLAPGDVYGAYSGGDVWSIDLGGGAEHVLIRDAFDPAWSPDGNRIAFSAQWSGSGRIWIADPHGRNPRQATTDTTEASEHLRPSWSPGGDRIVFQYSDRTQFDIQILDLETEETQWLTKDSILDVGPVWSGDYVYFSSYRGGGINVWRSRAAPDDSFPEPPEQVTTGAGHDLDLALSADGNRLAMTTLRQNSDLWKLPVTPGGNVAGSPEVVEATTREESRASWFPDASAIAFNSDRTGDMNIWIRTLEDDAAKQVTRGPGGDFQPVWSPDGTHLVFFSGRGQSIDIWEVDLRNGSLRQLTRDPSSETHAFYSPDGSMIAYMSDANGRLELWVMSRDGSNQRQVTKNGIDVHYIRWTPDSRAVSFVSNATSPSRLAFIEIAGGDEQPTAIIGGYHHSYSPDRSHVIDVSNHQRLWVAPLATGETRTILEFEDSQVRIDYPSWSPDGQWVVFDRSRPEGGDVWMLEGSDRQ
ncbi:MAG: serine/threonine-protein kinase [Acidobacteria bacterium]|nr:serine/threonine-protein kinase [Acidobacteriota bacterium]